MSEVTENEGQLGAESRTPQEGCVEERSVISALLSDVNTAIAGGAGGLITAAALKVADKFGNKSGPSDAGQAKVQDPGSAPKAD